MPSSSTSAALIVLVAEPELQAMEVNRRRTRLLAWSLRRRRWLPAAWPVADAEVDAGGDHQVGRAVRGGDDGDLLDLDAEAIERLDLDAVRIVEAAQRDPAEVPAEVVKDRRLILGCRPCCDTQNAFVLSTFLISKSSSKISRSAQPMSPSGMTGAGVAGDASGSKSE